jgi:uncharacterized protein (UPF0332 family)
MVAARLAYYAAFHAAEAFIVDQSGKVAKTHTGVRAEFARLSKGDPNARGMLAYLASAYAYKQIADYAVGPDLAITPQQAEEAIEGAERFVQRVAVMLG